MLNLKQLRTRAGISQAAFASYMGVAQNTVSNWENEHRTLDTDTALKIADYFHVSVDYLLGNTQESSEGEAPLVVDEDNRVIRLDADSMEILRAVRERPEMKIMFSVTKNVTPEDLMKAIKIVEAFKTESKTDTGE